MTGFSSKAKLRSRWKAKLLRSTFVAAIAVLQGCGGLSLDTYWRSGDYLLIAVDVKGQMSLSVDLGNGGAVALVGPTVFSLGSNEQYIVAKQHPATNQFGAFDRNVTNYFVVARIPGSALDKEKGVRGPLTKAQFDRLLASETLPAFTKTFNDLN